MPADPSGLAHRARGDARHILSQPPFTSSPAHPSALSRFFHDLGQWLYDVVGPVWRFAVDHIWRPVDRALAGTFGPWWPLVLGAIVVALAVLVGLRLARRRARVGAVRTERPAGSRDEDPDALDAAATAAEREGDYELAVRLRFRAGLARLERGGLIMQRRTHTSAQLARMVRSPTFDLLAGELDGILYGGRAATAHDVDTARAGWPKIPDEARSSASTGGRP